MQTTTEPVTKSSAPSVATSAGKNRSLKITVFATVLLLAAGSGVYFFSQSDAKADATAVAPPATKVTVAAVEQRLMVDYQELIGRVDAIDSVEVRPRVSGHIDQVRFQSGQLVKPGDVLFVIDPRYYRAQFDLATAQVERAKVRVDIAEREAKRSDDLLAARAISTEEADTRTSRLAEARADLLAAQAAVTTAKLDLEYTEVRSPIAGRVSRAFVTPGNLVSGSPGSGTLLTSIVSTGEVYVYADVDESSLLAFNRLSREGRLAAEQGRVGVNMQLSDESDFSRRGYIESADNRLDPNTGSLTLRMVFPNPNGELVPGLYARVRLPVSAPGPALLISERAIGTDQSQKFVLTVAPDKTVAYRTVKLGPVVEGKRIIRSGLKAGEQVIVNGLQRVRPGMTVDPETAVAATTAKPAESPNGTSVAVK